MALLEESMSDEEFENFMKQTFRQIAPGDRFILGVSGHYPARRQVRTAQADHGNGPGMGPNSHGGIKERKERARETWTEGGNFSGRG